MGNCSNESERGNGTPFFDFDAVVPDESIIHEPTSLSPEAQAGMAVADEFAEPRWKREFDACVLAVARRMPEFTSDDVLDEIALLTEPFETHNLSAIGPRMKEVSETLKYMDPTERMARSKRGIKHGNLHRIWKSNKYRAPQ